MEFQRQILLHMAGLHTTFQNHVAQFLTLFGEQFLLVAIAVFIYWNINRKKGFVIAMSLINALTAMGIIKAVVRFPRPWILMEDIETIRLQTATGYSFPSGHTTGAASTFTSIAVTFRKRWLSIVCAVMITLTGLSRIYLCVHWPQDVIGGILIGCGLSFLLAGPFGRLYDNKEKSIRITLILGIITAVLFIVISILLSVDKIDAMAFEDLNITFSTYSGLAFGYALERKVFDFKAEEGSRKIKVLRYVIGLAVMAGILFGMKELFIALGIYNPVTRAFRYFLVGFWGCAFPALGRKFRLFTN
ncbi:MAG: phosphatase PAP2 family protein [Spirochaetales bacterium]|nr:phosphatase PAP2 family protein [Spirochaetales bacterium]